MRPLPAAAWVEVHLKRRCSGSRDGFSDRPFGGNRKRGGKQRRVWIRYQTESASSLLLSCLLHLRDLHPLLQHALIALKFVAVVVITCIDWTGAAATAGLLPWLRGGGEEERRRGRGGDRLRSVIRLPPTWPAGPGARLGFYKNQHILLPRLPRPVSACVPRGEDSVRRRRQLPRKGAREGSAFAHIQPVLLFFQLRSDLLFSSVPGC